MTTEQIIVLGLLAAAYVAGWVMGGLTYRLRNRRRVPPFPTAGMDAFGPSRMPAFTPGRMPALRDESPLPARGPIPTRLPPPRRATSAVAVSERAMLSTREELDRAIRAYHAAVAVELSLTNGVADDGEAALRALAHALLALAEAAGEASERLERDHPLAETLRQSGPELVEVASAVMARSKQRRLPAAMLDRLEQDLASAAAAILGSGSAAGAAA